LIFAAIYGHNVAAKHLIKSDVCNVNAQNINGETALMFASYDYLEIVKLILQKDCSSIDVQTVDCKRTALMRACSNGEAAIIELLVRSGANLDLKDKYSKTAFQYLYEECFKLSPQEKTPPLFLKDLPRLIRQEQLQIQMQK
jgi:ankyrin repeat protein